MVITLSNGTQLRGDIIKSAILRSDSSPIPVTLEALIRVDNSLRKELSQDKVIEVSGYKLRIIKTIDVSGRHSQGVHNIDAIKITAFLDSCHQIAFVRSKAIIKNNKTLSVIYRASGAKLPNITNDFNVPRCVILSGDTPSFHITRMLQEEGGVVRWKNNKMEFLKVKDLFKQRLSISLPNNASKNVVSGLRERHEIPSFYSLDNEGKFISGNTTKARTLQYAPFKDSQKLTNMSRVLVQRKIAKININVSLVAGDLIEIQNEKPLVIITVAHVFESGTDGGGSNQYSRLWLSGLVE